MKLKSKTTNLVEVRDWDEFIQKVYGKPYSFQQQDGCKDRGTFEFTIPLPDYEYNFDYSKEGYQSIEEALKRTGPWLPTRLDLWLQIPTESYSMFDDRRLYPHVMEVIKDLESKDLLTEGHYIINIDW